MEAEEQAGIWGVPKRGSGVERRWWSKESQAKSTKKKIDKLCFFKLIHLFLDVWMFFSACTYMYAACISAAHKRLWSEECVGSLETGVTNRWEVTERGWSWTQGPLQEWQVLPTAELLLQSKVCLLVCMFCLTESLYIVLPRTHYTVQARLELTDLSANYWD